MTHPRVFDPPTDLETALEDLDSLFASPWIVLLGEGPAHTDACLTPPSIRGADPAIAAMLGTIDGRRMALIMNEFIRRFFDYHLSGTGGGLDADFRADFPEVVDGDLSPIRHRPPLSGLDRVQQFTFVLLHPAHDVPPR